MPDENKTLINDVKDKAAFLDRSIDKGIVNEQTGSSIGIRGNGDVSLCAGDMSQYKISNDTGIASEVSTQSNTITNRKVVVADEIIINKHKLNPQIYEATNIIKLLNNNALIGDLNMCGTILVKAYDYNLGRFVLIRRRYRGPLFSQALNDPEILEGLINKATEDTSKIKNSRGDQQNVDE